MFQFLLQRASLRLKCTITFRRSGHTYQYQPQASQILPGLYIGDMYTATSPQTVDDLGITHILSLHSHTFPFGPRFKSLWIKTDTPDEDPDALLRVLPHTTAFLEQAMRKERQSSTLVCCKYGTGNSAAAVIGYLIAKNCMTFEAAMAHVKSRRPVVDINANMKRQLLEWQKRRQRMMETALESKLESLDAEFHN